VTLARGHEKAHGCRAAGLSSLTSIWSHAHGPPETHAWRAASESRS